MTTSAPENTLAAFEEAIRLNVDAVELDVRPTRDTVPIVYHYAYLDGFTDARGPVFAYSLADLRRDAWHELSEAKLWLAEKKSQCRRMCPQRFGGQTPSVRAKGV